MGQHVERENIMRGKSRYYVLGLGLLALSLVFGGCEAEEEPFVSSEGSEAAEEGEVKLGVVKLLKKVVRR